MQPRSRDLNRIWTQWSGASDGTGVSTTHEGLGIRDRLSVQDTFNKGPKTLSPKPFGFVKSYEIFHRGSVELIDNGNIGATLTAVNGNLGWAVFGKPDVDAYGTIAYNKCLDEFYEKLRGSIDLSVDIAQAGQVARMIKGVGNIVRYVNGFPKSFFKGMVQGDLRPVRDLGSRWLEFQYGWKPLASTVFDIYEKHLVPAPDRLMIVRGKGSDVNYGSHDGYVSNNYPTKTNWWTSTRCEIKARFKPSSSMAQTLGEYTSLNPASILWELTPWSFVVDWVLDLGGYIRNMESAFLYGSRLADGYITHSRKVSAYGSVSHFQDYGFARLQVRSEGSFDGSAMQRQVLTTLPKPAFPSFKAELGAGRLLNSAALLSQFLGRKNSSTRF